MGSSVVIVGAAAAGVATAEALRRHGHKGTIVVLGDEIESFYDRPPLSKQVLAGTAPDDRVPLFPEARLAVIDADFRLGMSATRLDRNARTVRLEDGSSVPFDALVIATGVRPRVLPGADLPGVFMLRRHADAIALRTAIRDTNRLVIVGGGFIGLEVAATARGLGVEVTVIEPQPAPLGSRIGTATADLLVERHRAAGVDLRLGRTVTGFDSTAGRLSAIRLDDSEVVAADTALIAIGTAPNVEWLEGSGLDLHDGVTCDEFCCAAPGIWAVGDVARWRHLGTGDDIRIEHRTNATEQADAVARNLTGSRDAYVPVPYFWTDQYDVKLQLAGFIPTDADEELTWTGANAFVRTFSLSGRLVGALGWNAGKALLPFRRELRTSVLPVAS